MDSVGELLKNKINNNVNNDIKNIYINDSNVNNGLLNKYALNKGKFRPSTEETIFAEVIAENLGDLKNYACFLSVVNKIGRAGAERLLRNVLSDIKEKEVTKYPVRNKGAYFMWKYTNNLY